MINVPVRFMKVYRGNSGIVPLILNLGTKWRRESKMLPDRFTVAKTALEKAAEWVPGPGPVWLLQSKGTSFDPLWKSNQHSSVTQPTFYSHYNE